MKLIRQQEKLIKNRINITWVLFLTKRFKIYEVWSESIGTLVMVTELQWSYWAQIVPALCQEDTYSYKVLAHFPCLQQCFKGKSVTWSHHRVPIINHGLCDCFWTSSVFPRFENHHVSDLNPFHIFSSKIKSRLKVTWF